MSLVIRDLKESNAFLNILFENITSAVFIVDKDYKVHTVNNTFEILFEKQPPEILGYLCGDVIGCGFASDENKSCGATSHCKKCDLRNASYKTVVEKQAMTRKVLSRDFVINNQRYTKHFLFSSKPIHYEDSDMAMIIVDDITESEEQKNEIREKNREIMQSIRYARGIQTTVLTAKKVIQSIFHESFVLFMPKDIISGDFYWVAREGNRRFFAVADCTGHGVPGAIMSMLGITLLNEITRKFPVAHAGEILDRLRGEIIHYLKQQGVSGEHKDGMDIALCIIETAAGTQTRIKLQYAGANIPLYVAQSGVNSRLTPKNNSIPQTILEVKPDKQPIGIYVNMVPFTVNKLTLKKGDMVYLASDGYEDQFGGPEKKKFKSRRMKDLFAEICHNKPGDQLQDLEIEFLKWKGRNEQVDDVCIFGVRL